MTRRTRGFALFGAAAACAGLAASSVSSYTNDVRAQVGPLVPVVVAASDLPAGRSLTGPAAARALELRRVPARFAPRQALTSLGAAVGSRLRVDVARGDYVTSATLASAGRGEANAGGRVVEVTVAGAGLLGGSLHSGTHVDVLITTDRGATAGRTYLALQDAELVGFTSGASTSGIGEGAKALAALRVSLRQAVLLTAAQSFARELRLVPREPGDRRRLGSIGVSAADFAR